MNRWMDAWMDGWINKWRRKEKWELCPSSRNR
jgi:hypothetical protein